MGVKKKKKDLAAFLISELTSGAEYNVDQCGSEEMGFATLTNVRYTDKQVDASYFMVENRFFKIACTEVLEKDLPEQEQQTLNSIKSSNE